MAENPLLPNAKLREMYALMQRTRRLLRGTGTSQVQEAVIAATLMQLEPGDFVNPAADGAALAALAAERIGGEHATSLAVAPLPRDRRLAVATGVAQGMKLSGTKALAAVYVTAGSAKDIAEPGWEQTLAMAQKLALPLVMVCSDEGKKSGKGITWEAMAGLTRKIRLPVLTVDGRDAVAVYRVMQESAQRARTGLGPAVMWCSLALPSGPSDSLVALRKYMSVRNISLRDK